MTEETYTWIANTMFYGSLAIVLLALFVLVLKPFLRFLLLDTAPCPSCDWSKLKYFKSDNDRYVIGCLNCKNIGPSGTTEDDARKKWNKAQCF